MNDDALCKQLRDALLPDDRGHVSRPVEDQVKKACDIIRPAKVLSESAVEILSKAIMPLGEEGKLPVVQQFFEELFKRFPDNTLLAVTVSEIYFLQNKKDDCVKLLLEALEKDPRTYLLSASLGDLLTGHEDRTVKIRYWAVYLRGVENDEGAEAARNFFGKDLRMRLLQDEWLELWYYILKKGWSSFMKLKHQPEYLIVYDCMWDKFIESYFVRKKDVPESEEPQDTLNGAVEEEHLQEFIKHLIERYPEQEVRFKIRTVNADSFASVLHDIKWLLD